MKDYILFYDNHETGHNGLMRMQFIGDPFLWVLAWTDNMNPFTILTLVEI